MGWLEKTSNNNASLKNMTPMEANAILGKCISILGSPDSCFNELEGTGRPLEGLINSIRKLAGSSKGGDLGNIETHDKRLAVARHTIALACSSDNSADKKIGDALNEALGEVLPYTHVIKAVPRR
jgi:hypothetical protein